MSMYVYGQRSGGEGRKGERDGINKSWILLDRDMNRDQKVELLVI